LSEDELSYFSYSRTTDKQNMLIFIIEDVQVSEDIYSDATAGYIHEMVERAKYTLIGFCGASVLFNFTVVLIIMYI
jgi:hypothetical protein|tara:strand:+ start:307 stop:534 length:228 start_codon:yes stop_codon:yes gene_type:complete